MRRDHAAWDRVRATLNGYASNGIRPTHAEVARMAGTTYEVVRAVRREVEGVQPVTPKRKRTRPHEVHADTIRRIFAAHDRGKSTLLNAIMESRQGRALRDAVVQS